VNGSRLKWKNITLGVHEFPFGYDASNYIPVITNLAGGAGDSVTLATRSTPSDNTPWEGTSVVSAVTTMAGNGIADISIPYVVDRWWDIDASGVTMTVTFSYRGAENTLLPGYATGYLCIQEWPGSAWGNPISFGVGVNTGIGTMTFTDANIRGYYVIVAASNPLPVKLLDFQASRNEATSLLHWTTASEWNSRDFEIQRSNDGTSFETIGQVAAQGESGNSNQYEYVDESPFQAKNYYRLKEVDNDNRFSYSGVQLVDFGAGVNPVLQVFPNPANGMVSLELQQTDKEPLQLAASDQMGRSMMPNTPLEGESRQFHYDLDVSRWPSGYYVLHILSGGQLYHVRLSVVHP